MASLISRDTKEEIDIPVGETTIGRGPFLKVIETKVSRKHAVIAFDNDGIRIKPIHKNPTFLYNKINQTWQPLVQDKWCAIQHDDLISLLPDALQFEIKLKNQENKNETDANQTQHDNVTNDVNLAPSTSANQFESIPNKASFVQDKATAPSDEPKMVSESRSKKKVSNGIKRKEQLPRKRQLPSWMLEVESSTSSTKKKVATKTRKTTKDSSPKGDNERGDSLRKQVKIPLESSESPEEKEKISKEPSVTKLGECSHESPPKQSKPPKLPSPVKVEPSHDLLSDLMGLSSSETGKRPSIPDPVDNTDVDVDESGSVLSQLMDDTKHKKKPIENSEEIGDLQQEEKTKKDNKETEDEDKNAKNLIKKSKKLPSCPYGAKCYRRNPVHFQEYSHDDDGTKDNENSDDNGDNSNDDRQECQYGISCYRTNPQHKRDFKHTKDLTKRSPMKKRTTASRAAKGKSVLDGDSDDNGEGNTYDYDDSFIDDDDGNETDYGDKDSDDEDYHPEDEDEESENLSELVSEAKDFVNKKN